MEYVLPGLALYAVLVGYSLLTADSVFDAIATISYGKVYAELNTILFVVWLTRSGLLALKLADSKITNVELNTSWKAAHGLGIAYIAFCIVNTPKSLSAAVTNLAINALGITLQKIIRGRLNRSCVDDDLRISVTGLVALSTVIAGLSGLFLISAVTAPRPQNCLWIITVRDATRLIGETFCVYYLATVALVRSKVKTWRLDDKAMAIVKLVLSLAYVGSATWILYRSGALGQLNLITLFLFYNEGVTKIGGAVLTVFAQLAGSKNLAAELPTAGFNEIVKTDACIICSELLTLDAKLLECGHIMHIECLEQWFVQRRICPICRRPVKCVSKERTRTYQHEIVHSVYRL